jgi:23S rRNA (cytosine1962-C5)-methyltransferase
VAAARVLVRGEGLERARRGSGIVYRKWVESPGPLPAGSLVELRGPEGEPVACGLWEPVGPVAVRVLQGGGCPWEGSAEAVADLLEAALRVRERLGRLYRGSFRLVNSDGDRLSGLIVDYYSDVAVLQSSSAAIDALVDTIASWLSRELGVAVYEKSTQRSRRDIGLPPRARWLRGRLEGPARIEEAGVRLLVDVVGGQKTGFYLDQRPNRVEFQRLAGPGDRVLDVFSYTGGFALHALHAGASRAVLVEEDPHAARLALENARLNSVDDRVRVVVGSVWEKLGEAGSGYTLAAVDPPAFIQSGEPEAVRRGKRAYWRAYTSALSLMDDSSIAYLSSCSYFLQRSDFTRLASRAAVEAGFRGYRMLGSLRGAGPDHTLRGEEYLDYLKGAFLYLARRG